MFEHVLDAESRLIAVEKDLARCAQHLANWFENRELPEEHTGLSFLKPCM